MEVRKTRMQRLDVLPTYMLYLINFIYYSNYLLIAKIKNQKHHIKKLKYKEIKKYVHGDTLFIFGSGKTINEITEKQWEHIRKYNSFGFNKWIIHDYVPTFYMFENGIGKEENFKNFEIRKNQYKEVPIIYKIYKPKIELSGFPTELTNNLYLSTCFVMPGSSENKFYDCLSLYGKIYGYLKLPFPLLHVHKTGTLFDLILIATQLNYRKIVLMGVDLNSTTYFYEENLMKYKTKGLSIPPTGQHNTIHKTYDKNVNQVTIDMAIKALRNVILNKRNIKLYIGSKKSALYPLLPYYFDENEIE